MTREAPQAGRRILLIEDDPVLGPAMLQRLRLEGFDPRLVSDGRAAILEAAARPPDVILSDMRLPDISGEDAFRAITERIGLVPTYFMTAFGDVEQAVRLVKAGARDYLIKPVDVDRLMEAIATPGPGPVLDHEGDKSELSQAMRAFDALLTKAARNDLPLLLHGETGVGKERAARQAHERSGRSRHPFVAINCGAIPRDLAESLLFGHEKGAFTGAQARAQGVCEEVGAGTLLLDEIAELPLDLQPKLLRLIQERRFRSVGGSGEKTFDGRVVAATHRDLKARVSEGLFREDLYFRLAVIELTIPPLRERREDIPMLAKEFLADSQNRGIGGHVGTMFRLSDAAMRSLQAHRWPGNIRELRNRIERAMALADGPELRPDDLFPERLNDMVTEKAEPEAGGLDAVAEDAIRARVLEALRRAEGNQSQAARALGVSRTTIWKYARRT